MTSWLLVTHPDYSAMKQSLNMNELRINKITTVLERYRNNCNGHVTIMARRRISAELLTYTPRGRKSTGGPKNL